jgi:hypothetical protein
MYYSIIENEELNDYWAKHCKLIKGDITAVTKVPKPYEDINDAFLIYQVLEKQNPLY